MIRAKLIKRYTLAQLADLYLTTKSMNYLYSMFSSESCVKWLRGRAVRRAHNIFESAGQCVKNPDLPIENRMTTECVFLVSEMPHQISQIVLKLFASP